MTPTVLPRALAVLASVTLAVGLATPAYAEDARDDHVDAVLVISVDGLNPRAIKLLGATRAPAFHRLMAEGAYTLQARTEYESTATLPNHTGMVTGRRVEAAAGGHGVDFNEDNGSTVHAAAGERVRSVFNRVHNQLGSTAVFVGKDKFDVWQRSWPQAIDRYTLLGSNPRLVDAAIEDLKSTRRPLTFVHLSLPDRIGHRYGFMSTRYLDAVALTDGEVGRLLDTVAGDNWRRNRMAVIVTSDHGGLGGQHYDESARFNYRVPFFAWGAGIKPTGLYRINPAFQNPRKGRPSYAGIQPIRNGMVANLVTDLLDIKRVPGSELNVPRRLQVFAP